MAMPSKSHRRACRLEALNTGAHSAMLAGVTLVGLGVFILAAAGLWPMDPQSSIFKAVWPFGLWSAVGGACFMALSVALRALAEET